MEGGVSSIRFPHAPRAPVLFRAIQRIRIAHDEDRISGPQRRPLTALRLGKSAAEAPRPEPTSLPRRATTARTNSSPRRANERCAEDEWIHLKSMITPSAPSASCSPRRCVFKTMETPLSFFNHNVPAPSSPSAHPARIWPYTPAKSARS